MDISLDKVLEAAKDSTVGSNASSIMGMLEQLDKVMGHVDKAINLLNKAERSPLLGTLFRANMQKAGIDVKPLIENDPGIVPNSDLHKQILENINKMSAEQLTAMMNVLMEHDKMMEQKTLDGQKAIDVKTKDGTGTAGDRTGREGIKDGKKGIQPVARADSSK